MSELKQQERPICKVHGMIAPRAMCGSVIVGLKYCGFSGECQHKGSSVEALAIKAMRQKPENEE